MAGGGWRIEVLEITSGATSLPLRPPPGDYASALVLRRPVTRSPVFHCPRFLRTSTRSKRFMTLRLAPVVLAARRLRCCDINIKILFTAPCGIGLLFYHTRPQKQMLFRAIKAAKLFFGWIGLDGAGFSFGLARLGWHWRLPPTGQFFHFGSWTTGKHIY
jgi:hypothetical protein